MCEFGITRVRGGSFCTVELPEDQVRQIKHMITSATDRCFRCGGDHLVVNCDSVERPEVSTHRPEIDQWIEEGRISREFGERLRRGGFKGFRGFKEKMGAGRV
jgi:hypothetical protein